MIAMLERPRAAQTFGEVCRYCGKPRLNGRYTVTCGREPCRLELRRDWNSQHDWESRHPDQPWPGRKSRLSHCVICGKRLGNERGTPIAYCSAFCRRVAASRVASRYYWAHREEVLAKQHEYARWCQVVRKVDAK